MSDVRVSGPLFDGRAIMAVDQWVNSAVAEVGRHAEETAAQVGSASFKHETGNWSSHISMRRPNREQSIVSDGVIYGPWLEGTSSRNKSSRFKGYRIWRRTTQKVQSDATKMFAAALSRYIRKMQ